MPGPAGPSGQQGTPRKDRPKVQAQRLERLERRQKAGKEINEARLEKLQAKAPLSKQEQQKLDKIVQGMYGGPGQATAGTAVAAFLNDNPELAPEVLAFIRENRGQFDETGFNSLGNALIRAFPGIRDAYLAGMGKYYNPTTHQVLPIGFKGGGRGVAMADQGGSQAPVADIEEWMTANPNLASYVPPTYLQNAQKFAEASATETPQDPYALNFGQPPQEMTPNSVAGVLDLLDNDTLFQFGDALSQLLQTRKQRAAFQAFQGPFFDMADFEEE